MEFFKNFLLLFGCVLLVVSLWPIRQMVRPLPRGKIRHFWRILFCLVCLFITGYLAYTFAFWGNYTDTVDLIVPIIFFFGAVFVLLVCTLSLQTAQDIKRIFVLERENTTDELMGIYNRRFFDRRLQEEFVRSIRYRQPLSLLMVDIDHFKKVNDRWGHQVGDLVLQSFAELTKNCVRESDVVCRYGGEELAIILPHTTPDAAMLLAQRLRCQIEKTEMMTEDLSPDHQAVRVTASLGMSTLILEMENVEDLLRQADMALYHAKQHGRNMAIACQELNDDMRTVSCS